MATDSSFAQPERLAGTRSHTELGATSFNARLFCACILSLLTGTAETSRKGFTPFYFYLDRATRFSVYTYSYRHFDRFVFLHRLCPHRCDLPFESVDNVANSHW